MSDNEVEAPNNAATQAIATGHGVTDIAAVALKLPSFWSADPQVWFAQVESQFFTRKITNQDTKFHHIVACLPPEVAVDIRDLIINKPPDNAYDELKNTLIKRTTASRTKRLQQLLSAEELGDRKPSQLLRRFEQLLDGTSSDHPLIREVFLERLPGNVRQIFAISKARITQQLMPFHDFRSTPLAHQRRPWIMTNWQMRKQKILKSKRFFKLRTLYISRRSTCQ